MSKDIVITFEQVRKNQIRTVILIAVYVLIIFLLSFTIGYYYYDSIALGILIGVFIVGILVPIQILTGKNVVGSNTRWHQVDMNDPDEREVQNLVEGLAIASGLRETPKVYIIPTDVPNAFAGGLSLKNSYIGVTRGLMYLLDKTEMEGVIAHEMSHITHRDVLVSTVSIYLMSAAIMLGTILYRLGRHGKHKNNNNSKDSGSIIALIALVGLVLSIFIKTIAKLINLAVSRKREYMADANAVRICGYSDGLANALEKISNYSPSYSKEQVDSLGGEEMLCMYINNPKNWILPLFSTHPPIEKRIELLRNMY